MVVARETPAAAHAAFAGFVKQRRADRQHDAVISVLVSWVDGMAFRFWFLANDQGLLVVYRAQIACTNSRRVAKPIRFLIARSCRPTRR